MLLMRFVERLVEGTNESRSCRTMNVMCPQLPFRITTELKRQLEWPNVSADRPRALSSTARMLPVG
jgi:hypothetical protein